MTSTDTKGESPDKKDEKAKDSKVDSSDRSRDRRRSPPREGGGVSRDTNKNDPRSLRCRVFIGNLPSDKVSRQELESMFMQYGAVIGCSVHTNFGFVQFGNEKDADVAVSKEHGRILYGKKIDVNLAGDRQKSTKEQDVNLAGDRRKGERGEKRPHDFNRPDRGRERRSPPHRGGRPYGDYPPSRFGPPDDRFGRGGSPPRDPFLPRNGPPRGPHDEHYDERRGEPFERYGRGRESPEPRDPYYRRDGPPPFRDEPPLRRNDLSPRRDPYYDDRPPPREGRGPYDDRPPPMRGEERYREGYPERRDEFGRPHSHERDYSAPFGDVGAKRMKTDDDFDKSAYQKPGAPIDCEIIVVNKQQRGYADLVERRLKGLGLITLTAFLPEHKVISDALDDVSRRGILYAIVITSQHEVHRSVTVNILHGTAQGYGCNVLKERSWQNAKKNNELNWRNYRQLIKQLCVINYVRILNYFMTRLILLCVTEHKKNPKVSYPSLP